MMSHRQVICFMKYIFLVYESQSMSTLNLVPTTEKSKKGTKTKRKTNNKKKIVTEGVHFK